MAPNIAPLVAGDAEGVYERPEIVQVVGARLDDPVSEALPLEPDDPRVLDQDSDGEPGVTALIPGVGAIYVVRRERYAFHDMAVLGHGRLRGVIDDTSEQVVLAASNPALDVVIVVEPHPDPALSSVEMVRLDAPLDCDALMERIEGLFPDG